MLNVTLILQTSQFFSWLIHLVFLMLHLQIGFAFICSNEEDHRLVSSLSIAKHQRWQYFFVNFHRVRETLSKRLLLFTFMAAPPHSYGSSSLLSFHFMSFYQFIIFARCKPDVEIYNALISAHGQAGQWRWAMNIMEDMLQAAVCIYIFPS